MLQEKKVYKIDDVVYSEDEFMERMREDVECVARDGLYDEMLDDCYEALEVGCVTIYPSEALAKCDPIAYSCGLDDFVESQMNDYIYELEQWGSVEVDLFTYELIELDEDESYYEVNFNNINGVEFYKVSSFEELIEVANIILDESIDIESIKEELDEFDYVEFEGYEITKHA